MGRKKIKISRINDERNRQVTFTKRKFGLMKKAYELSVLCDCEIALIIFNSSNKLFQYASTDMDKVLLKYTEYNEPHESRTNNDIIEVLNKKENKGCESPDGDPEYTLTPRTEEKYKKINDEFDRMMGVRPQDVHMHGNYPPAMPVSIPVSQQHPGVSHSDYSQPSSSSAMLPPQHNPRHSLSPQPLIPRTSLSPQPHMVRTSISPQPQISRNSLSPRPPPRPASTGNGYLQVPHSQVLGHPGATSPVSNNNHLMVKAPNMQKQQLTSPANLRPHLKVVIPTSRSMLPHGQLNDLATPTVSLATPSNPQGAPNYPSAMATAYQAGGEFPLNSANIAHMQSSFDGQQMNITNWQHSPHHQQGPLTAAVQAAGISHHPLAGSGVQGMNLNDQNIKCEPISPPKDKKLHSHGGLLVQTTSASSHHGQSSPSYADERGLHTMHSGDAPPHKRSRVNEAWVS
ncbi:myocyte-specific enhancer factor 2C-like isoform X2 [Anneissia japonica]|uniref:myocyte-specific enhancer factor 2C-like isoform X2 n=1 Tax=Anneissia japonica TaxID=1529436 RepID=UPI001425B4F7|nr:myocyte-specific enhancer factor 2C-like isoform X2 [Anneissia japonica]